MADCPSCGAELRAKVCPCGYAVRPAVIVKPFTSSPQKATQDAFNARHREVEAYVENYQTKNPGATKRQACLAYLKARGQEHLVPSHIRESVEEKRLANSFDDAMDEYRAEVEA
jgi:hypothetical protein